MEYKYITENNLEERQNYMYSAFGGDAFLKEYFETREMILDSMGESQISIENIIEKIMCNSNSCEQIDDENIIELKGLINNQLKKLPQENLSFLQIDLIVKTFEVRKRLYHLYSPVFKPLDEDGYKDNELYLLFAVMMCVAYEASMNLKYLNSLLKVNDILISILTSNKNDLENEYVAFVLMKELYYIKKLCENKNIKL